MSRLLWQCQGQSVYAFAEQYASDPARNLCYHDVADLDHDTEPALIVVSTH
jgi:hypothetical protein